MRDHCNTPFPVLTREQPPKRKPWESEHYRMSIFTAAGLLLSALPRRNKVVPSQLFPVRMLVSGTEHIPGSPKVSPEKICDYACCCDNHAADNNDRFEHKMIFGD